MAALLRSNRDCEGSGDIVGGGAFAQVNHPAGLELIAPGWRAPSKNERIALQRTAQPVLS
jgi:hypothetical protein